LAAKDDLPAFFEKPKVKSEIKASIVSKYFGAWQNVIGGRADRIVYADLFAGPGRFKNGAESTPLLVLKRAIDTPQLRHKLVTVFCDAHAPTCRQLQREIDALPGIEKLGTRPVVECRSADTSIWRTIEKLAGRAAPTLVFLDPWGYAGLTLDLIKRSIEGWGCECIFFFNYSVVSRHLANPAIKPGELDRLFGDRYAAIVRAETGGLTGAPRRDKVYRLLCAAVRSKGGGYIRDFNFLNRHFIIHVTKHVSGHGIMKGVMAAFGRDIYGVPTYRYLMHIPQAQEGLWSEMGVPELADDLAVQYSATRMTLGELFLRHHPETPYIPPNYRHTLFSMELQRRVILEWPAKKKRRSGTLPADVTVIFPRLAGGTKSGLHQ
jgi:three-Cys-motif partner protein